MLETVRRHSPTATRPHACVAGVGGVGGGGGERARRADLVQVGHRSSQSPLGQWKCRSSRQVAQRLHSARSARHATQGQAGVSRHGVDLDPAVGLRRAHSSGSAASNNQGKRGLTRLRRALAVLEANLRQLGILQPTARRQRLQARRQTGTGQARHTSSAHQGYAAVQAGHDHDPAHASSQPSLPHADTCSCCSQKGLSPPAHQPLPGAAA